MDVFQNFNELNIDLNDERYFPADIYERTYNPNHKTAVQSCDDSLDEYAGQLTGEILAALEE